MDYANIEIKAQGNERKDITRALGDLPEGVIRGVTEFGGVEASMCERSILIRESGAKPSMDELSLNLPSRASGVVSNKYGTHFELDGARYIVRV